MRLPTGWVPSLPTRSKILSYTLMTMIGSLSWLSTSNFRQVERQSALLTWGFVIPWGLKNLNFPSFPSLVMRAYNFSWKKVLASPPNGGMNEPSRSTVVSSFVTLQYCASSILKCWATARHTFLKFVTVAGPSWFMKLLKVNQREVCPLCVHGVMCFTITSATDQWMWSFKRRRLAWST